MIDIGKYEAITKIDLDEDERKYIEQEISSLMNDFDKLGEIDTEGIEPLVTVLELSNIYRDDIAVKWESRDRLLDNAPSRVGEYFEIPKIL